jgi:Helix-turn-helix domain/HNH endonuclease
MLDIKEVRHEGDLKPFSKKKLLTVEDVALELAVNKRTVKNWMRKELFPNAYQDSENHWYIPKDDIDALPKVKKMDERIIRNMAEIGKKYNRLTILEITDYKKDGTGNKIHVLAKCDCGNGVEKPLFHITNGIINCCSNDCITKSGFTPGDRYGFLTIIGDGGLRFEGKRKNGNVRRIRWVKVKCDCGDSTEKPLKRLKSGEQKSCGTRCKMWNIDINGKKFGFLTVLKEVNRKKINAVERVFICQCDCGKKRFKLYSKLTCGHVRFCSSGCVLKRGENHPSWKPEKSMEERLKDRDYAEYNEWRDSVYIRDLFTCQCCGETGAKGKLAAHHKDGYNWCIEKRTDIDNGVTLCEACHNNFHELYGYGDNTESQFEEWMEISDRRRNIYEMGKQAENKRIPPI